MAGILRRTDEHEQVEALLSPYLDGRTSGAERALVERHIESCGDCARSLGMLRATVVAVREMPRVRAPRSFALPRSMARPARAVGWPYPLLRAATGVTAFLFALVLGMDLFAQRMLVPAAAPQMAAPAAPAPTVVAMESATQATAPAATGRIETLAATAAPAAPQFAAPVTPTPSTLARQDKSTQAPTSAPSAFGAAPAPAAATPAAAAKAAELATPAEPSVEQPLTDMGVGGGGADNGLGGGGQAPGPLPAAPLPPPQPGGQAAEVLPTPTLPVAAPTEVARAAVPQPPAAEPRGGAFQLQRLALAPLRIAEGGLAVLAVALGVAAWIARRRSR
jgi:Putative zinc-finger